MENITEAEVSEAVASNPLLLIDVWATWCQPCKTMLPILQHLEDSIEPLTIVKVDADANPDFIAANEITSIPTLILYKNGEQVWKKNGAKPFNDLMEDIKPYV